MKKQLLLLIVPMMIVLALATCAYAIQIIEWRSDSGNIIRLQGTENMEFHIFSTNPKGVVIAGKGQWTRTTKPKSFIIVFDNAPGDIYQCTFSDDYHIKVIGSKTINIWTFSRFISK